MKLALAGNPNSGKTTLFNAITGKTEYVGNWPGVTVEKKVANLKRVYKGAMGQGLHGKVGTGDHKNKVSVVDLPGAYSIAPYTQEETITRDFITGESPDVIINIVDATSLERSLFFTTQLLELGLPVVVALNKQDLVRRQGSSIDSKELARILGCPVVPVAANAGEGLQELTHHALSLAGSAQSAPVFAGQGTPDEDKSRHQYVREVSVKVLKRGRDASVVTFSDRVDRIVAHAFWGLPIFALVMWGIYTLSINGLGGFASGYLNDTFFGEIVPAAAYQFFAAIGLNELLQSLVVDGILGGVGAVLGFLPLIMVLFFLLALVEDSGYMARIAVVMDRYFKKIGLSGKSIIPMIVGSGCSIPGVMASRTIEDENERRVTTMLTPFVPCSAKLPVIALFGAVFFPGATWVFPAMYLIAGALIIIGGLFLKKLFNYESTSSFIIELPEYRLPSIRHALTQMYKQAKSFVIKASTIILVMNTLIWFTQTYSWTLRVVDDPGQSMLAAAGTVIAPLLIPLGFIGWQAAVAVLAGFVAKENVVSTFAIVLAASDELLFTPTGPLASIFTPVTAFAFLSFNLFVPPCFAAIGAMNAELGHRKWLGRALVFQLTTGYTIAMLITQVGTLLVTGQPAPGLVPAIVILIALMVSVTLLLRKRSTSSSLSSVAELKGKS
ncbi:MAG: ferrous iron transporter B [Clostridia bacterium]|nr:ferrous iron transporter B [Clostridia bacterium]